MAKRKDDFSFSFSKKPKDSEPETPAETPAEPSESPADPFASSDTSTSDPFASTETPADPFASTEAPSDPFASADSNSTDPFASTETPAADPFASTESSSDPFASASTDTSSDPFASAEPAADPFATAEAPAAEAPPEEAPAAPAKKAAPAKSPPPKQFRILLMADFSGRTNRAISSPGDIASRKVRPVDVDTLDKVLAALKPEIHLPVSDTAILPLTFASLDDFRPDAIINQVPALQALVQLLTDLKDNKKFKDAAAKVRKLLGIAVPKPKTKSKAAKSDEESDFERLLNQPIAPKDAQPATADALIASIVSGYIEPSADPDQPKLVALVEEALSDGLRAILRHPAFQALESAWRSVHFLTSRLDLDGDLKISLLDISKDELYADLVPAAAIEKAALFQILVEQTKVPGTIPYSLVVGDYEFDQTPQNVALLAKIATLMSSAGLPFLAGASPKIAGFPSFHAFPDSGKWQPPADAAMWEKIRGHKFAAHIGLAAPRFLLRLPYGPKTDAIDTYPFNEMPQGALHDQYLWANGAYGLTYAIAKGFLENGGWGFEPGTDIDDLPCHMALVDGDKEMTPCAEGWLSDRIGDILYNLGLTPLLSVRNAAAVKLQGIHSIAKGGKPLAANWATA